MSNIIVTTPEELKEIITDAISKVLPKQTATQETIDSITLNDAVEVLREHGYPTSKAKIYKLTSTGKIPVKVYGNKLVFSRKEILLWAENQLKPKHDYGRACSTIARSARRKK